MSNTTNNNLLKQPLEQKKLTTIIAIMSLACLVFSSLKSEDRIFAIIISSIEIVLLAVMCLPIIFKKFEESDLTFLKRMVVITSSNAISFMLLGSNEVGKTIGGKVLVFAISLVVSVAIMGLLYLLAKKSSNNEQKNSKGPAIAAMVSCAAVMVLMRVVPDIRSYALAIIPFAVSFIFVIFFYVMFVTYKIFKNNQKS